MKGIEYVSVSFNNFYNTHGIIHEKTTSYSLEMNSRVKWKNKTLFELGFAILLELGAASYSWGQIIQTVFYVLNKISKSKNITSP